MKWYQHIFGDVDSRAKYPAAKKLGNKIDKAYDRSKTLSEKAERYSKKGSKLSKKGRRLDRQADKYDDKAIREKAYEYLKKGSRYSEKGRRISQKALRNDEWIKRKLASLENLENGKEVVESILKKHALD